MITADDIDADRCAEVWRLGCLNLSSPDVDMMRVALVALNALGSYTTEDQHAARVRCAEILSAQEVA